MRRNLQGPVVVGVDGSDASRQAAIYGAWEACRRGVPVRLVFAYQPTQLWGAAVLIGNDELWERKWARELLEKTEKEIITAQPGVTVETAVVVAPAGAALVEQSQHASLVVVGTRSMVGLRGRVAGSVAAQVVGHAAAPVVVVRSGQPAGAGHRPIAVGLDGSPESQRALEFAVEEAVARGTGVHAVFVKEARDLTDVGPIVENYLASEEDAHAMRLVTEATEGWSDRYPDVVITHSVIHALDPAEALARVSQDAELTVVGTRGRGGFLGLRLGSTSDGLIRQAAGAVMVIPAEPVVV